MIKPDEIKSLLSNNYDVKYRALDCASRSVLIIYIESMCDKGQISEFIVKPLLIGGDKLDSLQEIKNSIIQTVSAEVIDDVKDAVSRVLNGDVVLLFSHLDKAIYCKLKGYTKRAIETPLSETVIKGPREGFTEDLSTNISEIRRRIKSHSLKLERYYLGTDTQTETVLVYIEENTPEKLISYIRSKILQIKRDNTQYIFYINHLESLLKCKYTPFDTIGYTEKPDVAAAKLAEGRVVVLMDGNPFVITAPYFFIENFQTTDDYTLNPFMANMGRLFRWIAFFMSTFAPGIYLALVTYHYKLVPNIFLYRLALFRAGVPVPTFVELLYMIFFFQLIREAGVRLPQPIGTTLSIVGALILGEAAVTSGLSSQITVVVVAISSIASYLVPVLHAPNFTWGVSVVILSALVGLPGFYIGFIMFASHLAGLTSCGYPYLYPLGTGKTFKYSDIIIKGAFKKKRIPPLSVNK